jgi:hypothetical protein
VLVWVADAQVTQPVVNPSAPRSPSWTVVLPILPKGASANQLPQWSSKQVARWYDPGHIGAVLPDVLVNAGLGLDAFRLFISYKWDDSCAFAEQLFHALSEEQFDVYLDRFRTNPGTNFAERIRAELADKACVVVLDSRYVSQSPWVAAEYAFARQYRLGLMAIDLPGGHRTFPRIGNRLDLRRAKRGPFSGDTSLSQKAIASAVGFLRSQYFVEVSRRFRYQRKLVNDAARLVGLTPGWRPDGLVEIGAPRQYVIATSARPPGVENFRSACEAAYAASSAKAVVVGPLSAPMHQTREDIRWLARATNSVAVDERRLLKAMQRAKAGRL